MKRLKRVAVIKKLEIPNVPSDPISALYRLAHLAHDARGLGEGDDLIDAFYELFKDKGWLTREAIQLCEEEEEGEEPS